MRAIVRAPVYRNSGAEASWGLIQCPSDFKARANGYSETIDKFKDCDSLISKHLLFSFSSGKFGIICVEDLIHEIFTVGPHFKMANNFLWHFKVQCDPLRTCLYQRIQVFSVRGFFIALNFCLHFRASWVAPSR